MRALYFASLTLVVWLVLKTQGNLWHSLLTDSETWPDFYFAMMTLVLLALWTLLATAAKWIRWKPDHQANGPETKPRKRAKS